MTLLKHKSHESTFLAIDLCSSCDFRLCWKSSSRVCTTYCRKRSRPGGFSWGHMESITVWRGHRLRNTRGAGCLGSGLTNITEESLQEELPGLGIAVVL